MNGDRSNPERPLTEEASGAGDGAGRSGEGSNTALEALIRNRKLQGGEATDERTELPPAPAMP